MSNLTDIAAIIWRPALWPAHIAALAALLAALAVLAYWRSMRRESARAVALLLMRMAVIAALALVLMGPSVVPPRTTVPQRPRLYVMLDTSASMQTADADGRSRIRYVLDRWLSPAQLQTLREQFDLRLLGFDEQSRPIAPGSFDKPDHDLASGGTSRYVESIGQTLLDVPRDGLESLLLVIGDGHDTEERTLQGLAGVARQRHTTIHAVAVGSTAATRDLAVVALPRQEYLLADEPGQLLVRLMQVGAGDAPALVHITGPSGKTLDRRIPFPGGQQSVSFELPIKHAEPGTYEYRVKVDPLPGEKVTGNNEQSVFIEVAQRRMRVLVLEGEPFWDTKFLAQSLRTDPRVELTQIAQLSPAKTETVVSRSDSAAASVPRRRADWAAYDVVVLGRGMENVLPPEAAALLVEYVKAGGHVIFARGRPYDPDTIAGKQMAAVLWPIEPVVWGVGLMHDMPLTLSPAGRAAPSFSFAGLAADPAKVVAELPPLDAVPVIRQLKPATQLLAVAGRPTRAGIVSDAPPAMVAMNLGSGRVFAVLGEGLWRWSFLPPELKHFRGVFDSFWSNTVRWLALGGDFQPGEEVSLKLSRTSVRAGDPLAFSVAYKGAAGGSFAPKLTVTDPDGVTAALDLAATPGVEHRLQAQFTPTKPGVWRATLDAPPLSPAHQEKRFSVYNIDLERLNTAAMPRGLAALTEATGGIFLRADQDADLAQLFGRRLAAKLTPPAPQYVWDNGLLLAALLGWIGLEWIGRRSSGWL